MKLWKHMKEVHGMKLVIELVVELVMVLVLHRYGARRRRRLQALAAVLADNQIGDDGAASLRSSAPATCTVHL